MQLGNEKKMNDIYGVNLGTQSDVNECLKGIRKTGSKLEGIGIKLGITLKLMDTWKTKINPLK